MENLIAILFAARDTAHIFHWKVKSLSLHLALGDLYEKLIEFADELAEMYMGQYGSDINIQKIDDDFNNADPIIFIGELVSVLERLKENIPQDGFLINKYEELQGTISQIKYKLENLA